MTPKLVVISAPSGGGKTTLCNRLLQDFPELTLSISSTTRAPRGQEQDGREYFFLSRGAFEQQIREGRFAEWAEVHGNLYGTSKTVLEGAFARGQSVLLDIDVQGAASLALAYPGRCVRYFVAPPSLEALEARLRARGTETDASVRRRLENARAEMARAGEFDSLIVNDDLERAYSELCGLVKKDLRGA
jgi:guanylate kinase